MNDGLFFLLLTGACGMVVQGCLQTIKGDLAEKNWRKIQSSSFNRWFFQQTSHEQYIKQQKVTAWFVMILFVVIWMMALWGLGVLPI